MQSHQLGHANGSGVPSEVISRYLEAIYYMRAEGETVTNARLAEWLSVSRPTVTRISEVAEREAPSLLHYLHERNLVPGTRLTLVEVDRIGNTMRISAVDREVTLSRETAGKVWVLPE